MSIIQIMVTIIIVTILVTVILGVASYAVYWLRRTRRPAVEPRTNGDSPRFFYRYLPEAEVQVAAGGPSVEPPDEQGNNERNGGPEPFLASLGVRHDGSGR